MYNPRWEEPQQLAKSWPFSSDSDGEVQQTKSKRALVDIRLTGSDPRVLCRSFNST